MSNHILALRSVRSPEVLDSKGTFTLNFRALGLPIRHRPLIVITMPAKISLISLRYRRFVIARFYWQPGCEDGNRTAILCKAFSILGRQFHPCVAPIGTSAYFEASVRLLQNELERGR